MTEPRRLVTARELAEALGISTRGAYRLAELGQVPHYKVLTAVRFDLGEVRDFLRREPRASGGSR